jgi:hypothetical protein
MTLGGDFRLSNRWPNGQWITSRTARWTVDRYTYRATSAIGYTPWVNSWAKPGTAYLLTTLTESIAPILSGLQDVAVANVAGDLLGGVQIGVWNGSRWEYGSFDSPTEYQILSYGVTYI